jgi:hypothetical protein
MQSVPIGTEPVMDQANAGDPSYRCMIGGHGPTLHTPAMLRVVADLRSDTRALKSLLQRISQSTRETKEKISGINLKRSHES